MNRAELNEHIIVGIREGRWIAYIADSGAVRLKHPRDATATELLNRLTPDEARAMLKLA